MKDTGEKVIQDGNDLEQLSLNSLNDLNSGKLKLQGTPMMEQYLRIKSEYQDCLLLFRMGDFYELFFEDALEASKILNIALTSRGKYLEQPVPMCGVPYHASEFYLLKLVKAKKKVAVCDQVESPQEAKKRGGYKALVKREVTRVITAGTLLEEEFLKSGKNNFLMAIVVEKNLKNSTSSQMLAIAILDISTGDFFVESVNFKNIIEGVIKYNPKEIIIQNSQINQEFVTELRNNGFNLSFVNDAKFNYFAEEKRVKDKFGIAFLSGIDTFTNEEVVSIGVLLEYVANTQKTEVVVTLPKKIKNSDYMQISADTLRNLEIWHNADGNEFGSLFNSINCVKTAMGHRLLAHRIAFPIIDKETINDRLNGVEWMSNHFTVQEELNKLLNSSPDFERAFNRISFMKGSPRDLGALLQGIKVYSNMIRILKPLDLPGELKAVLLNVSDFSHFIQIFERALADNLPINRRVNGYIRSGYSNELDDLRNIRDNNSDMMKNLQNHYVTEQGIPTLKIKNNNMIGWFIEIPMSQKLKVPEEFIWKQTISNNLRYTSLELEELQTAINSADSKIFALEMSIFEDLVNQVINLSEEIKNAAKSVALVDLICSFSEIAITRNFVRPTLRDEPVFYVKNARHPVVEFINSQKNNSTFVPNDCNLGLSKNISIITGPNMSGKSTFLRQNALIVIMAHVGSFVPAETAEIGIVDCLFSRIGAYDNLISGKSTFMVEMIETAAILNQATERSFVILDEVGRGTSTFDGMSIAYAVIKHIHEHNKSRTLFATHYHELCNLVNDFESLVFQTLLVKEWNDEIIFEYKIISGIADRSYGIHVAKLAGIPPEVIVDAKSVLRSLENNKPLNEIKGELQKQDMILYDSEIVELKKNMLFLTDLRKQIKELDLNALTPKQSMDFLYQLQAKL